jgi:hypothetical protein
MKQQQYRSEMAEIAQAYSKLDRGHSKLLALAGEAQLKHSSLEDLHRSSMSDTIYAQMEEAKKHAGKDGIPQRLATWRGELWASGFGLKHPHPTINRLFADFVNKYKFDIMVQRAMTHLSIMHNACLVWRWDERKKDLEYVEFYDPSMTKIDLLTDTLWLEPKPELKKQISSATPEQIRKYLERFSENSTAYKWVKAIQEPNYFDKEGKYSGMVPLRKEDGEFWLIIGGGGHTDQTCYAEVLMLSIFSDIELLNSLKEGDWTTAFMMKNMIELVTAGESITSGPIAGSKRLWVTEADLKKMKEEFRRAGKAQRIFANHTVKMEHIFPDPKVFSPEKYSAARDRVCFYFGIGPYAFLGSNGREGGSYSTAAWNIGTVRLEATQMRKIVSRFLYEFLANKWVCRDVFGEEEYVYAHQFAEEISGHEITTNIAADNFGALAKATVEYATNGFGSETQQVPIRGVLEDIRTIVTEKVIPDGIDPRKLRLKLPYPVALEFYGFPDITWNQRLLKDDRQALAEIQAMVKQGPLSNTTALGDLGWDIEREMTHKRGEWDQRMFLAPIWESSQGGLDDVKYGMEDLYGGAEDTGDEGGDHEGEEETPGREESREEGERKEDGGDRPRPSN